MRQRLINIVINIDIWSRPNHSPNTSAQPSALVSFLSYIFELRYIFVPFQRARSVIAMTIVNPAIFICRWGTLVNQLSPPLFYRSSASLTHAVIPIPVHSAMHMDPVYVVLNHPLAPSSKPCIRINMSELIRPTGRMTKPSPLIPTCNFNNWLVLSN